MSAPTRRDLEAQYRAKLGCVFRVGGRWVVLADPNPFPRLRLFRWLP